MSYVKMTRRREGMVGGLKEGRKGEDETETAGEIWWVGASTEG